MALDPAANFVRGKVNGSVASGDTTFSVADASIFPDPTSGGSFNAVIWDAASHPDPYQDPDVEIVRVTGRDTTNDNLTVTRGQESTSDVSHPSGSSIQMSPTAKMFGDIDSDKLDSANYTPEQDTHDRYTDSETRSAVEAGDVNGIQFTNKEQGDYDKDGFLYWDLSDGLYIKSSNAPNTKTGGALVWSGANVFSGNGISLSYGSSDKPTIAVNVVASGTVTLSSGQATIDTGIATTTTATFMPAAAPATDDADVAADVRADSGSGNYEIDIQETDTSVGNPDVYYDIIRVR